MDGHKRGSATKKLKKRLANSQDADERRELRTALDYLASKRATNTAEKRKKIISPATIENSDEETAPPAHTYSGISALARHLKDQAKASNPAAASSVPPDELANRMDEALGMDEGSELTPNPSDRELGGDPMDVDPEEQDPPPQRSPKLPHPEEPHAKRPRTYGPSSPPPQPGACADV